MDNGTRHVAVENYSHQLPVTPVAPPLAWPPPWLGNSISDSEISKPKISEREIPDQEISGQEISEPRNPQTNISNAEISKANILPTVNSEHHILADPFTCDHDDPADIEEIPTFDGWLNRRCRRCGTWLRCRKSS
jgi:hypothetical protein